MDNTQNWVNPTFNPRPAIQGNPWGRPAPQGVSRQDIPARPIPTPIPNPAPIPTPAPAPAPASTTNAIPSIPTPRPRQMSLSERLEMLRVDMEARLNEHGFVGFQVRLSENSRKNFIGRGRSGIIKEGDPNEVYQRIRQSADDNGDMEYRRRSGGE